MPIVRGIIDTVAGPRLTDLQVSYTVPVALANPYSGAGDLTAIGGGVVPYGLIWTAQTFPVSAGGAQRAQLTWELPWLSLCPSYATQDGNWWALDHLLTHDSSGVLWFERGAPTHVEYSILDGWTAQFQWLVAP